MGLIDNQLERLRERLGRAHCQEVPAGWVIQIPTVGLPAGWNKSVTRVFFLLPQGYPFAKPDCFWTDPDLRLANGNIPQNAQLTNPLPGITESLLWFSWHVDPWNPNRDDLVTWVTLIKQRLSKAQ